MGWVFAALIVVIITFVFLAAAGRLGQIAPQVDDRPVPDLPSDRPLTADDLSRVKFAVVLRGYSMEQVDALLDRLGRQVTSAPDAPAGQSTSAPDAQAVQPTSAVAAGPDRLGRVPNGWPAAR